MLAAWSSSPTRFREDVNTEDDLRAGGYASTWVAEVLQNAADAAVAAGAPGRVRAHVHPRRDGGDELRIANTGAPLDAAGVAALASLRASAKRDVTGATGRFGVGFAAVLAVCTEPRLVTAAGGVAFSASRTAAEVTALGGPAAAELARDPRVPVLRLVWPTDEEPPPEGYATEVRLPAGDPGELLAELARAGADLLLALPALDRIEAGDAVLTRTDLPGGRVRISTPDGVRELLTVARGPVRWALPLDDDGAPAPFGPDAGEVLHAPTASVEALPLPARLFAPFPLDPDRRRIRADDPATAPLVECAAGAYADLVRAVPPGHRTRLVPAPGFPRSPLDGRLREAIAAELGRTAWLPAAADAHPAGLAPDRAEWLDLPSDGLPELLAAADPAFARLVATGTVPPAGLDVTRVGPAELARRLTGVAAAPSWWRELYALLARVVDTVPGLAAELGALPVPLADGRLTPGPSGVLLPGADTPQPVRELADLRIADPDAVHPLLRRLGATDADRETLLGSPALHELVARSVDDADAGLDTAPLARAVLALLDTPGAPRRDWAGALALTDDGGLPGRADELVLPDAAVAPLLDPEAPVGTLGPEWLPDGPSGVSRDALVAAGVLDGFAVVGFDPDVLHDGPEYGVARDGDAQEPAVRDLDLVADDAWPAALALLAGGRETRAAVLTGYTAWWLARYARIDGRLPATWRLRSATGLAGLYDPVPELPGVDEEVLAAIGVRRAPAAADADEATELLDRLGDPGREVTGEVAAAAYAALTGAVADGTVDLDDLDPPQRVRTPSGRVVPAEGAVVLDAPWVLPALGDGPGAVPVVAGGDPRALAELLDLPTASERVTGTVRGTGEPVPWAALPEVVLTCRALGVAVPDGELAVHERLVVELDGGGSVTVPAWPDAAGGWHASDPLRALVAALAGSPRARMRP